HCVAAALLLAALAGTSSRATGAGATLIGEGFDRGRHWYDGSRAGSGGETPIRRDRARMAAAFGCLNGAAASGGSEGRQHRDRREGGRRYTFGAADHSLRRRAWAAARAVQRRVPIAFWGLS